MFRRSAASEEPLFLKELLQALRESEESLAADDRVAAESAPVEPVAQLVGTGGAVAQGAETVDAYELSEMDTIRAELALLRELSAEWKEAVRIDREQTSMLPDLQIAA